MLKIYLLIQNGSYMNLDNFRLVLNNGYACAMIMHTWADQQLIQLLKEHFYASLPPPPQLKKKTWGAYWFRIVRLLKNLKLVFFFFIYGYIRVRVQFCELVIWKTFEARSSNLGQLIGGDG